MNYMIESLFYASGVSINLPFIPLLGVSELELVKYVYSDRSG